MDVTYYNSISFWQYQWLRHAWHMDKYYVLYQIILEIMLYLYLSRVNKAQISYWHATIELMYSLCNMRERGDDTWRRQHSELKTTAGGTKQKWSDNVEEFRIKRIWVKEKATITVRYQRKIDISISFWIPMTNCYALGSN